jgi:hypothetical protein
VSLEYVKKGRLEVSAASWSLVQRSPTEWCAQWVWSRSLVRVGRDTESGQSTTWKKKSYLMTLQVAKIISVGESWMNEYGALVKWCWQGRENWHSTTLTTTNPRRTGLGMNPVLQGGIPATNRLELWIGYRGFKGVHYSFPLMLVCIGVVCMYELSTWRLPTELPDFDTRWRPWGFVCRHCSMAAESLRLIILWAVRGPGVA